MEMEMQVFELKRDQGSSRVKMLKDCQLGLAYVKLRQKQLLGLDEELQLLVG